MKHVAIIISIYLLFFTFGLQYAQAQPVERGESAMMQNCPMSGSAGMASGDLRGSMRMAGHMGIMTEDIMEARHRAMGMMMNLGLDEQQKETIHAIIDRTARVLIKKRADLLIAKIDLEEILHKDPVDLRAAEPKLKQIEAMKTDMFLTHLKAFEEIKSKLTPEQRGRLKEMMEMHMMGGMMKGCGCGMTEETKTRDGEKK